MNKTIHLFAVCMACTAFGQSNIMTEPFPMTAPTTTLAEIGGATGGSLGHVASDGSKVFSRLSLDQPITGTIIGVRNGSHYGAGVAVSQNPSNSVVGVGFAVLGVQDVNAATHKTEWGFYDATLNLSVSTIETIPVLNLPLTLRMESGPALRLSGHGNRLLEQSAAFGTFTFEPWRDWPITLGGGAIHCSAFANVLPMGTASLTHNFRYKKH